MLRSVSDMKGLAIHASDGEIGSIEEFYFDDETWAIRYLIVNTGSWLSRRQVLISPVFLDHADWENKRLHLTLTKKQIEDSPEIDTQQPVSRQHEAAYMDYFASSYYWGGSYMWGMGLYPANLLGAVVPISSQADAALPGASDSHLRSTAAVTGYHIEAANGDIGHVEDFLVDQDTWAIRYLEVDTRNWLPGKKVLMSPALIIKVSWSDSNVYVSLPRESIESAPEYIESRPITREYEDRLHAHYGMLPYWVQDTAHTLSSGPAVVHRD